MTNWKRRKRGYFWKNEGDNMDDCNVMNVGITSVIGLGIFVVLSETWIDWSYSDPYCGIHIAM